MELTPERIDFYRAKIKKDWQNGHRQIRLYMNDAEYLIAAYDQLSAAHASEKRLRHELQFLAIQPEYDCPGDTPEICGYTCLICMGLGKEANGVKHHEHCVLSEQFKESDDAKRS